MAVYMKDTAVIDKVITVHYIVSIERKDPKSGKRGTRIGMRKHVKKVWQHEGHGEIPMEIRREGAWNQI